MSLIEVLVLQGYRLSDFLVAVVPREQSIIYISLHNSFPLEGGGGWVVLPYVSYVAKVTLRIWVLAT